MLVNRGGATRRRRDALACTFHSRETMVTKDATKVAVVGAGRVGSTFAYTLAASGLVRDIVVADADLGRAEGEAMDIAQSVPFRRPVRVEAGTLADVGGAAVTVITAGAAQQPGEPRTALVQRNVDVLRGILEQVVRANPDGLLLIATNPVDALTWAALKMSGLPWQRVIGSGTVLDSARLRAELAAHYAVDARNVHAYVLGEHGDSEFVAWSTATLGNMSLADYCAATGTSYEPAEMERIGERVRRAAYEIIQRKGATNFAIAAALTRIIEAIVRDEQSVLTVSTLVQGEYGLHDVCLSLPAIVGRGGVQRVLPVPLSEREVEALRRSAQAIRTVAQGVG
jgi:L-lactate dehydrogenase